MGKYLAVGDNTIYITESLNDHSIFTITDNYGQTEDIDWAKYGETSQSSTYDNYTSNLAVDGQYETFSQTLNDISPWFKLKLPKDIFIKTIHIENRKTTNKDILNRLRDFDVTIFDSNGIIITAKHFDYGGEGVTWDNINVIGRLIKIQLRNQDYLHINQLNVFGNTSFNKKYNKYSTDIGDHLELNNVYIAHNLPHTRNKLSITFWGMMNLNNIATDMNILNKGTNMSLICKNKNLYLQVNDDIFNIETTLPISGWNHYTIVIDGGINSYTGWQLVQFNEPPSGSVDVCCYYVNSLIKQYYKGESNVIYNPQILDSKYSNELTYMGKLPADSNKPKVTFYINGHIVKIFNLTSVPQFDDTNDLIIGKHINVHDKHINTNNANNANNANNTNNANNANPITLENVKYFNYILTEKDILHISKKPSINTTNNLLNDWNKPSGYISIDPMNYPSINEFWTLTFWIISKGIRLKVHDQIQQVLSGLIDINIDNNGTLNIQNINSGVDVFDDKWHHVSVSYSNKLYKIYIDTNLVRTGPGNNKNNIQPIVDFRNPIIITNFNGQIYKLELSNYVITKSKLIDGFSNKPDDISRKILIELWKINGCSTDIIKSDKFERWLDMLKNGQQQLIQNEMAEMRYSKFC